jgi:DNA (cytosine-5)-methyltransferase 1
VSLITFQKLGRKHESLRLWIESQRLDRLGFSPGIPLSIETHRESLMLRPAILGENHVSSRAVPGGRRPIIDLANQSLLSGFADHSELKIVADYERISVTPSCRAFAIQKSRFLHPPLRVLEVFAGGGTMTAALDGNQSFKVVGGIEIAPEFADEWEGKHPDAILFQADIRSLTTDELPEFEVLISGIPCTSHSNLGRAKKGLAGKPELGDTGDLFLPVVTIVSERMPAAVILENVPSFGTSLAGELIASHLQRIGYHVNTTILRPNEEWGEIEDRKRWLLVATLERPFTVQSPQKRCSTRLLEFLDPPDPTRDQADAERIAGTIRSLGLHNERHRAAGHGFGFSVVDGSELRLPTIPKSYHKINTGPFVDTPFGPRLLRKEEVERIHGSSVNTPHYGTAIQILGQGVLTRLFIDVFSQLGAHLLPRLNEPTAHVLKIDPS